jgi:hypothetical protein
MKPIGVLILYIIGGVAILGIPGACFLSLLAWGDSGDFLGAAAFFIPTVIFLGWFARVVFRRARDVKNDIFNDIDSENAPTVPSRFIDTQLVPMKGERAEDKKHEILESSEKKQHSRSGIASFLLYIAMWGIRFLIPAFNFPQYPLARRILEDYFTQFVLAVLLVGTVLGIVSRFEANRKNRNNVFGIIGLVAHLLTLMGYALST